MSQRLCIISHKSADGVDVSVVTSQKSGFPAGPVSFLVLSGLQKKMMRIMLTHIDQLAKYIKDLDDEIDRNMG